MAKMGMFEKMMNKGKKTSFMPKTTKMTQKGMMMNGKLKKAKKRY